MTSRLHSADTLMEGMTQVGHGDVSTRKRELENMIADSCMHYSSSGNMFVPKTIWSVVHHLQCFCGFPLAKDRRQRVEALRRRLSNVASTEHPHTEDPGTLT